LLNAIGKSQRIAELGPDGSIIETNDNFCKATGYGLGEIKGKRSNALNSSNRTE
jgi:methyl-accepting chemotaxis protein